MCARRQTTISHSRAGEPLDEEFLVSQVFLQNLLDLRVSQVILRLGHKRPTSSRAFSSIMASSVPLKIATGTDRIGSTSALTRKAEVRGWFAI